MHRTGKIFKATGGFYYVDSEGVETTCRARGIFRNENRSPLVGDEVEIQINEDGSGTIMELLPRKNSIVRPPLANLDHMVVVLSVVDPVPNFFVADKFLALLEKADIDPIVAVTKSDLQDAAPAAERYRSAGYPAYIVSGSTGEGVSALSDALAGSLSAFSGNSGVGKSSLLNAIDPRFEISVGDTSKKLGRGRHTTRHVELFRLPNGALVADTPGFSSITLQEMGGIGKEELAGCFREFGPYLGKCKFVDCSHTCEKGCAVLQALEEGAIHPGRHESYVQLYNEVKDIKPWEQK